jgi:dihydrofolate reductase
MSTRQLIVFADVTLDGFMAGPNNDLDFMAQDPKLADEFTTELRAVADTIIFGRKSFDPAGAHWTAADGELADWMNSTPKVILSTDPGFDVGAWANSSVATDLDQIRRLKASTGGAVVAFGGVQTLRTLISAGLVDQYWLKINPVAVGRGGSMFSDLTEQRRLTLQSARPYPSGTLATVYSA